MEIPIQCGPYIETHWDPFPVFVYLPGMLLSSDLPLYFTEANKRSDNRMIKITLYEKSNIAALLNTD